MISEQKEMLLKVKAEIIENFNIYDFDNINEIDKSIDYVKNVQNLLNKIPEDYRPRIEKIVIGKNDLNISFEKESVKGYEKLLMTKWNDLYITNKNNKIRMSF